MPERVFPKSITRMDYKKNKGWYVRIKYKGVEHRKYFGDTVWGGYDEAFEAAIEWRDAKEQELGKPRTDRMVFSNPRNEVGVTGVYRAIRWTGATDREGNPLPNYSPVYAVTWSPEPGRRKATSFSIPKYGEEKAREMAIKLRREKEKTIYGDTIKQ
ncbi:MAG: AP2 domain-containing protein [Chloroflexota bacterium]